MHIRRLKFKTFNFDAVLGLKQRPTRPEKVVRGYFQRRSKELCSYIYPFSIPVYSQLFIGQTKRSGIDRGSRSLLTTRFYSSDRDEGNENYGKHFSVENSSSGNEGGIQRGKKLTGVLHCEEHARLGEQDQKDWLNKGIFSFDNQKDDVKFLTKREKFKVELLKNVIPWEKIPISWDTFPYLISEHTKNFLVESTSSHLKHKKFASTYGARLNSSSGRILLQGIPGTELYRERMVKALARDLQVPLLVLDRSILTQFASCFSHDSESDADDDNLESEEESESCSDAEEDTSNEGENDEVGSDENGVDVRSSSVAFKQLAPHLEEYGIKVTGDLESGNVSVNVKSSTENSTQQPDDRPFRKGDRVKYNGDSTCIDAGGRSLASGHRGEVYDINGDKVAVILDNVEKVFQEEVKNNDEKPYIWIDIQNIVHDLDIEAQEWYIATEALREILPSLGSIIIYFSDTPQMPGAVKKSNYKDFLQKLEEIFDKLEEPIVLICGKNNEETGSKEINKSMTLSDICQLGQMPTPLHQLTEGFRRNKLPRKDGFHKFFNNILPVNLPKEEDALGTFHKQLEEDRRIIISRNNLVELHRVLVENELSCLELSFVETNGMILTKEKAEQVVGWARNHYLSSCIIPFIKDDRLFLPRKSLEIGLSRLKELELISNKPLKNMKIIAKDDYEKNFISSVVLANETGVRFKDIGALEDVKMTLNELVTLPMRRPELFSRGNLLQPCKGILLFGPPGTGKTLLAKALAAEAGANFISVTGSILTSKWFGDAEKLTKALFSFASRLAPVIIFVDEVDSLLGARGGSHEHEATRRMRNEFMAAWDGLRSKENQRILVLGATNRPFDLDDAVIRRLPRRIYVDLPDAKNRTKILKIFLAEECIESCFKFDELSKETEGYSGSDLKNLCIAAAYRPIQELLNEEKREGEIKIAPSLRPLNLNDFLEAKFKVGASVAYDATSMNELRKWNERYGEGGSRKRSPFGFDGAQYC